MREATSCGEIIAEALADFGPALVEAEVDPSEPLLPPKRIEKYASNMEKALERGTPGAEQIRVALKEQRSRTLLE